MDVSLATVVERLSRRPGVVSVTFCTAQGLVVHTTLSSIEEARPLVQSFAAVVASTVQAYSKLGLHEQPEVVTVRSAKLEWIVTLADANGGVASSAAAPEFFFLVARDPEKK